MVGLETSGRQKGSDACRICAAVLALNPRARSRSGVAAPPDEAVAPCRRIALGGAAGLLGAPYAELVRPVFDAAAAEFHAQVRLGFYGAPTFVAGLEQAYLRVASLVLAHADVARLVVAFARERDLLEPALRHRAANVAFLQEQHEAFGEGGLPPLQLELLVGSVSLRLAQMVHEPSFAQRAPVTIAAELLSTARVFATAGQAA